MQFKPRNSYYSVRDTYAEQYIDIQPYMHLELQNYRLGSKVDELWPHETYPYMGIYW